MWASLLSCVGLLIAGPTYTGRLYPPQFPIHNITSPLVVDLGYEVYQGVADNTTGLNTWKGIRFAAPPTGPSRWQAPRSPTSNRDSVIQANDWAPVCPQGWRWQSANTSELDPKASEDCLFLNVFSPRNATSALPVLVWIHGGAYAGGHGRTDFSTFINANGNNFIGVSIQYRLGAFGFLSSEDVFRNGVVNAGLLDQNFALKWVQSHIDRFGGNASQVTVGGESAGAGSVMLHAISYGGSIGTSLFTNTIAQSPFLPTQYGYKDPIPSQSYAAFAESVGCGASTHRWQNVFKCLVSQNSTTLQLANAMLSASSNYGTFPFVPVTDGTLVQQLPSQQLLRQQVNGKHTLVGNNADEGVLFTPQNISTEANLVNWLHFTFPSFSDENITQILREYPSKEGTVDKMQPFFQTNGIVGPTAVDHSAVGTGQQQRANNIYAENTFVCPSYWMAEAYSNSNLRSYKYQYSVGIAYHAAELAALLGPAKKNQGKDFALALRKMWGNFITRSNPSISVAVANGASSSDGSKANPAAIWPPFTLSTPAQLNLNQTGGKPTTERNADRIVRYNVGPDLQNDFSLADAFAWEGGRGKRCG